MLNVVIVAASRTAIGRFNGGLSTVPAPHMSSELIKNILATTKINPSDINEVIIGQALQAGCGQNTARQALINAGIPDKIPAFTINKVCGSGMKAVVQAVTKIVFDKNIYEKDNIIIAGGHENMSKSPHLIHLRDGYKMGDTPLYDSMIKDGLSDAFNLKHMGITAENLAQKYKITREEQDEFAIISQQKALDSTNKGMFSSEMISIFVKNKKDTLNFNIDESIQYNTNIEKLSSLRPVFLADGTVTAGNSSSINDGAAMLLLMSSDKAKSLNLPILATIKSFAAEGVDPNIMGIGPVPATKKALELAKWDINSLDLIESNEAFAVQAIAVNKELGWNQNRVNVNGGAIALGHPIGASGARIIVTLVHSLIRRGGGRGLATLCIGGGMGIAVCIEVN
ncbi:acetyl-CoA C-acetyltransferase [Lyticum sinuosum]|uniref:Acetyl-CoA acetyltransferase n=1 Tax=Lyticum sinuosum TaxID=1332059 RepID=A0AAE4VKM5_9RICK|nr:acetyl-CoA C-acetyltransferase [Lyticum sinuosum]MDZ5761300.1 Acetyl-CoA acetyltransferase [Lyticum sinuosum]